MHAIIIVGANNHLGEDSSYLLSTVACIGGNLTTISELVDIDVGLAWKKMYKVWERLIHDLFQSN